MQVVDLPLEHLQEAPWNPNRMDQAMLDRLKESVVRFGLVSNLVVRSAGGACHEVLSGNQRLRVLRDLGFESVPCAVVDLDDVQARLLAQALNRIQGDDDLGLKAELVKEVLEHLPQEEVVNLLPETAESLSALSRLGQATMAEYLQNWQQAQAARLKHFTVQLLPSQQEVVEEALALLLPTAREAAEQSPNIRGTALFILCRDYLEHNGGIS